MRELLAFLKKRGVAADKATGLLYVVSIMSNFLIYHLIKKHTQLPVIRPQEEEADKNRMGRLGMALEHECHRFDIEFQEIMDELVVPMAKNNALVQPLLNKIYRTMDSLIPSDNFRQTTESQIENPEFWGDSLMHYADRKEDYFEAVKELFALILTGARPKPDPGPEEIGSERNLEEIRKRRGIDPDDFQKLRRRAKEFFAIAFATYLDIEFQPLREEVDEKIYGSTSD